MFSLIKNVRLRSPKVILSPVSYALTLVSMVYYLCLFLGIVDSLTEKFYCRYPLYKKLNPTGERKFLLSGENNLVEDVIPNTHLIHLVHYLGSFELLLSRSHSNEGTTDGDEVHPSSSSPLLALLLCSLYRS